MRYLPDADLEYVNDQAAEVSSENREDEDIGNWIGRITGDSVNGEKAFPN